MPDHLAPIADVSRYARERDLLLERIVWLLRADPRVVAVWLSGSFGRGEADEWSDFDLHVAVEDDRYQEFLSERPQLYARVGRPLLVQRAMPSDSMRDASFQLVMFAGPIEVDWNIGPVSRAERPSASLLIFDRAGVPLMTPPALTSDQRRAKAEDRLIFFWAMAPIAVKHAARGETRLAARQIDLLSQALIALWRLVQQPDGPEPYLPATNRPIESELDARLPRLGTTIDPLSALGVIRALGVEVAALHPALVMLEVPIPVALPDEVASLSALAEAVIREGTQPRRRYR